MDPHPPLPRWTLLMLPFGVDLSAVVGKTSKTRNVSILSVVVVCVVITAVYLQESLSAPAGGNSISHRNALVVLDGVSNALGIASFLSVQFYLRTRSARRLFSFALRSPASHKHLRSRAIFFACVCLPGIFLIGILYAGAHSDPLWVAGTWCLTVAIMVLWMGTFWTLLSVSHALHAAARLTVILPLERAAPAPADGAPDALGPATAPAGAAPLLPGAAASDSEAAAALPDAAEIRERYVSVWVGVEDANGAGVARAVGLFSLYIATLILRSGSLAYLHAFSNGGGNPRDSGAYLQTAACAVALVLHTYILAALHSRVQRAVSRVLMSPALSPADAAAVRAVTVANPIGFRAGPVLITSDVVARVAVAAASGVIPLLGSAIVRNLKEDAAS